MGIAEPEEEVGAPAPVGVDERTNRLLGTGVAPAPEPTPESTPGREARLDTKLEAPAEPGTRQRGRSLFDRQMDIVDPSRRYYEGKKDKHKDPSFARDVVWKTATDFAEIPEHMVKGLGTGIRNYAESAEGYAVAEIARLQEQISELADEDYVLPMAEEMYPLEFGMSEKERQKALEGQRRMTQAYRRTEEAQGGVDAKRERIERIQERMKGIQRFKEVFPEQDFEEVDNFVHQAAQALGQFAPSMAATAGGGLPIGLASYYMQFKGSMYEGMVKQGIPKDRAHDGARIGAALTSLIGVGAMSVSISALARIFPRAAQGTGASQANITKTRRALEDIRDFTTPPGMEWVAEFLQQYPEALGQVVAQMPKDATGEEIREEFIRYVQTEEFAKNQIMSANIAGMAGLFMPLGTASVGTAYRRYQMPGKKFDVEGAKDARTRLTDAYQREEGDMGLLSDHVIAQYNMDLYNRLLRPEGSIFDNMKRKAQMKELREAKVLKKAEEILEGRGQTLRPEQKTMDEVVSKETKEETADTMTKIWPKREKPDTVQEPEVTPDAAPVVEPEVEAAPVAAEPVTDAAPTTDVMTKKGTPFKSQTAAKSARTRQGMKETHDVVEVEGGYALRPAEQRVEPEAVAETAEVREGNVFEDLEMLLEEHAKIDAGESEMSSADLAPVLENVQNETIRYLEELDPSMRAAFVAGNLELSRNETRQLEDLLNKEATEGLTPEQNSIRNHLIRKMVGKEEITQEYLENKGKEPATEREELIDETPRYFDKSTESVETIRHMFEQKRPEQIKENPETMLGYLTNQINAWIHGVGNADVSRIRQTLQHMRDESSGMYDYFGNQVHLNDFIESVDHAIELANKAESLKTGGSGPILRVTTGLDLFYPAVRDIIAKVQSFRGKMQARDALNKLKKTPGVKATDLEFTGLDRYLNQAARNHQRVTKEELLAAAEKMPEVEITVKATDGTVALPKGYRELVQARDGIKRLAAEGMSSSEFIRAEAERLAPLMETQGVAEFTVDILESYLAGFHELIYVAEQLGDFNTFNRLMEEMPAYSAYSFFRNRNSEYQYEEVLINVLDYSPDPGDMVHSAFGQPVSFFARVARNQDRMIVEEVQSEIATMKSRMKGKPHPFKSDGWPNLIASTLLKRARELGYSEVYIPNFEWVNGRWSDSLPESTRPVYEKVMPEAMERLEAERLSDTIVEDARLGSSSTTPIGEAVARLDAVAQTIHDIQTSSSYIDPAWPNMYTEGFSGLVETLHELVTAPEYLSDVVEGHQHAEAFRNDLRAARTWTELAIDVWNGRDLFPDVVRDRGLNMVINDLVELGRHVERLEGILFDLEVSNEAVDNVISNIDLVLNQPEAGRELMQRVWNDTTEMLQKHTERTEEIPFQRYRVPREEPSPGSVPLTLNMGFDPTNVVRLAKRAAGKLTNQAKDPNPKAKGHRVAEMYKHTRDEAEVSLKQQRKEIENMLRTTLIDTTSPMKEMVKRVFGEQQSQEFINRVILAKGHSVRANAFLNRAIKDIYGKLGKRKREILDEVIFSSRLIQIGRYRGNVKDFKGRSPQEHRDFLNNLEEIYGLTEMETLDLFRRAIIYFDRTLSLLDVLLEDGLISKEEYADLKTFRWTRTEALKKIDPDVKKGMLSIGHRDVSKRKQAKTKDSGIQELELGSEFDTPNIDMAYVLADWTQRVMKRSALARMSESLWDLANSQQQNEIIRPAAGNKRPADWQTTQVIVRGEKKQMYVHPEFARHWMLDTAEISPVAANVARIMSGSFILRPMATGIRLGFIPVNISRDIILQQFSSKYMDKEGNWKPTWNTFTPLGIGQQLWYIGKVAPAALFRGKKYQQYADAGGSMLFMAVQGRPLEAADIRTRFGRGAAARTAQFQHSVDRAMDTLGYLNVTSEIITRLSLVERALDKIAERDGVTREEARNDKKKYEEAAAIARDYLDFGQAGSMVRAVDTFRPYTNASFQAGRSMIRSWQRDWKHAAFQSAQVAGIASLLAVGRATYMQDEDEDGTLRAIERDIPARDLARFFTIFPFGKEMYFENEYGEKHRPYFKIPIDGALIPPKILGEVATARILGEDIRGDVIREGLQAAAEPFSPIGGIGVPSLDAYFALAHNLDTFFGGKVWTHGDMVEAEQRVTKDTPQFIKDLADTMNKAPLANVSPHQLHHAARGMSAGGTWFTHHFGQAYDHFRDVPVADRELHLWEAIADHPSSGSLINYTRADVARFDEIESWEKEHITERKQHDLYVTRESQRIREILGGELDSTVRTVRLKRKLSNYIEANAKNDDHRRRMYEAMEFYTEMPSTPRFRQWKDFVGKTPETKAKRLRRMLRDAGPTERERIFNEAKMFPHADSKAMWDEFDRLTEQEIFQ